MCEERIMNFSTFKNWYDRDPKRRQKNYDAFCNLKDVLNGEDPIKYIHSLYYKEQKSLREILKVDIISWMKFISSATLQRLLSEEFKWKLREKSERTHVHSEILSKTIEREITDFQWKVARLLDWKSQIRVFNMRELDSKKYRIQKALYILETLWWIDKNILLQLSLKEWLSNAILAKSLNRELERILWNYPSLGIHWDDVMLYSQLIGRWLHNNSKHIVGVRYNLSQ